jgi:hypothetical protein
MTPSPDLEAGDEGGRGGARHPGRLLFGRRVAVDYALAHPDKVDGLVLVGPWVSGFDVSHRLHRPHLKLVTPR